MKAKPLSPMKIILMKTKLTFEPGVTSLDALETTHVVLAEIATL